MNGIPKGIIKQSLGYVPIMVKSKLCNLHSLPPRALIEHHEEEEVTVDFGGAGKSSLPYGKGSGFYISIQDFGTFI